MTRFLVQNYGRRAIWLYFVIIKHYKLWGKIKAEHTLFDTYSLSKEPFCPTKIMHQFPGYVSLEGLKGLLQPTNLRMHLPNNFLFSSASLSYPRQWNVKKTKLENSHLALLFLLCNYLNYKSSQLQLYSSFLPVWKRTPVLKSARMTCSLFPIYVA